MMMTDRDTLSTLEQFLYREAWLLDTNRFDEWLSLYTADCRYWVPLEVGQVDGENTCSVIHDDHELLEIRVRQWRHPRAHARVPLPRTVRQVGNVMLIADAGDALTVGSTLMVTEFRADRQRLFGARVEHELRRTPEGLRIRQKRVDLANAEGPHDGITIVF
jgi:benzoate/toluate 1,2-dioxygenase beta subunit